MIVAITANQSSFLDDEAQEGMLMDFGILKEIVNEVVIDQWDHHFLAKGDEWVCRAAPQHMKYASDIRQIGCRTTAENLSRLAAELIYRGIDRYPKRLDVNLSGPEYNLVVEVELFETETSSAVGVCYK